MDFKEKAAKLSKKISDTVAGTCNKIVEKSDNLTEEFKKKAEIATKEAERKTLLEDMGLKLYSNYQKGECVGKDFACKCKQLDDLNSQIASINEEILLCKGKRICKKCNCAIPVEDEFCSHCGMEQEPIYEYEDNEELSDGVCPCCGNVVSEDDIYCNKCGSKI